MSEKHVKVEMHCTSCGAVLDWDHGVLTIRDYDKPEERGQVLCLACAGPVLEALAKDTN